MTKLIVAFRNSANAPKIEKVKRCWRNNTCSSLYQVCNRCNAAEMAGCLLFYKNRVCFNVMLNYQYICLISISVTYIYYLDVSLEFFRRQTGSFFLFEFLGFFPFLNVSLINYAILPYTGFPR
jgi:hypothetical protein